MNDLCDSRTLTLLLFLFIFLPVLLFGDFNPLSHQDVRIGNGIDSTFTLSHRYIIPGTFTVFKDSIFLVSKNHYTIDLHRGIVAWHMAPDSGQAFFATYESIPVQLPVQHMRWTEEKEMTSDSVEVISKKIVPLKSSQSSFDESQLERSGSIFRGISLGTNQGMRLQSGLRLQLSGKIAPDIEVIASLTDQNTPIQPEGNTQTLQEIDKVFIKIQAPHVHATMGDFIYRSEGSSFTNYSRKLQGGMITAEKSKNRMTMMVAGSKGEFYTNHIQGQEGNQGPYQLAGKTGQQDIIVLAGTERVWIDGEEMVRGEDNDYVIEYGLGQIIFTRNRLITGDSRITVDFEYSDQKYQKTLYGAQTNSSLLSERLKIKTALLREADNKENPLDFVLTDEYRKQLEAVGDGHDSSFATGAQWVGENSGYYIQMDTLGTFIYKYLGENKGNYNVRFSHVGYGRGDYSFQGYGIYHYEGPGKGTYLPVVILPAPTSHQTLGMSAIFDMTEKISLHSEISVSDLDLNQFSSLGDDDNQGIAYGGSIQLKNQPLQLLNIGLGQLTLHGKLRNVGKQYRQMGRSTEIEHGRKWGVSEGQNWGEATSELQMKYRPFEAMYLDGELGQFKRGILQSNRKRVGAELKSGFVKRLSYQSEWIETDRTTGLSGYWLRQKGGFEMGVWKLNPAIFYEGEHRKNTLADTITDGFRFDEVKFKMGIGWNRLDASYEKSLRDDRIYENTILEKNSLAKTDRIQFRMPISSALNYVMMYTHRTRDYTSLSNSDQKSNLADAKLIFSPRKQFVTASLNYRFSSASVSEMVRDTIQVGVGFGNYRIHEELNELVPDPDGDLLIRLIPTGLFLPVNELATELDWQLDASKLWRQSKGVRKWLRFIKNRSRIRIERRDKQRDFREVNRKAFNPRWGQDSTVVTSVISMHHDLEYMPYGGHYYIRLRYRKDDSEDYQFSQEGFIRHGLERSLLLKLNLTRQWGLLFEYQHEKDNKNYQLRSSSNKNIVGHQWIFEGSFRPKQKLELAVKTRFNVAQDQYPEPKTIVSSLFFLPRMELSFRNRGRLRGEVEWGNVRSDPEDRALPYEMLNGDQPGETLRWTLLMTYRLTGHMQATLTYRGRREPWRDRLFQMGQVEVRAFF